MLDRVIRERIEKGVINFFESVRIAFINASIDLNEIDTINIFLAGNSSKAKILKDIFNKHLEIQTSEMKKDIKGLVVEVFKIYPPLGSEESYSLLEEMGLDAKREVVEAPTGKTGVAYGLIESRKGSKVKVKDHNVEDDITFKYYLGEEKKKKFKVVISREEEYGKWKEFIDAGEDMFEIFYTDQPTASTNKVLTIDNSIKRERVKIKDVDEDALIYIRTVSPTAIEYVVAYEEGIKRQEYLGEVNRIELG